jgi:hypothetical protein
MLTTKKLLSKDDAIKLARESMALKGELAKTLEDLANGGAAIFVTDLNPVTAPSDLTYELKVDGTNATVRFGDSIKGERPPAGTTLRNKYRMREVSDCALVLLIDVVAGQKGRVELAVTSDRHGPIINLEEDFADNLSRRCAYVWRFKVIKHRKMVDWYDPGQLARTAIDVLISTIFGRHSDYRLMEALVDGTNGSVKKKSHYDYTHAWKHGAEGPEARDEIDPNGASHTEFWIDYVGDVGDGWDSTYAIAHYLAQPKLEFHQTRGRSHFWRRPGLSRG